MRPDRNDASHLWDMLDAARAVSEFLLGRSLEQYLQDRMLRGSVERHVGIIGGGRAECFPSLQGCAS